ncbi:MAG: hypothetical protein WCT52_03925 [Candidatus Micrarchaeia archaeon]
MRTPKGEKEATNMIGKAEWFCPRKFGWGLGIKKVEGIVYTGVFILAVVAIGMSGLDNSLKGILSAVVIGILTLDILDIMRKVYSKLDEREQRHQLVAERNAALVAIFGLVAYGLYLGFTLPPAQLEAQLLPLVGVAVAMAAVKGATLLYMEREK